MHHIAFDNSTSFEVALLIKTAGLQKQPLQQYYIDPLTYQLPGLSIIAVSLDYGNAKKPSATTMKAYLDTLLPELRKAGVKYLYCADGSYFKTLTKQVKAEVHLGYVLPCAIKGYEDMQVILTMNHQAIFANDSIKDKIHRTNETLVSAIDGTYAPPGEGIIKYEKYIPADAEQIRRALESLHRCPALTWDTETFSLNPVQAKLGTISFAWNQHEGICIDVMHTAKYGKDTDLDRLASANEVLKIKQVLRDFFNEYKGKLIAFNATYDIKVMIYFLWMKKLTDTAGLLAGLDVMCRNFDDAKIIAYLATNTCSDNPLSLKVLAQEYAGNYAQSEINDITKIATADLMRYNLVDCLSTWYVYDKYKPLMVLDKQEHVYETLFKPMLKQVIQMELTGMPLDMVRVKEVDKQLEEMILSNWNTIQNNKLIGHFVEDQRQKMLVKRNAELKKKVLTLDEIKYEFNPGSNKQLGEFLHGFVGLPVINTTPTGEPQVGGDELKGHLKRTDDAEVQEVIQCTMDYLDGTKIRNTFVARFLEAEECDGWHWLLGSFNVGGTKSGRLSSSNPNMQNLPAQGKMGKLIKTCFRAPPESYSLHKGIWVAEMCMEFPVSISRELDKLDKLAGYRTVDAFKEQVLHISHMPDCTPEILEAIKDNIVYDPGWLFVGLDYASLEDRINTLLTKDPNKLAVYQGHIVYELVIDGTCHHIRDDATIVYDGKHYTGKQFYEAFSSL